MVWARCIGDSGMALFAAGNHIANAVFKIYAIRLHSHIRGHWFDPLLCVCDIGAAIVQSLRTGCDGILSHMPLLVAPIYVGSIICDGGPGYLYFVLSDIPAGPFVKPTSLV